jgi:hypothetical protein
MQSHSTRTRTTITYSSSIFIIIIYNNNKSPIPRMENNIIMNRKVMLLHTNHIIPIPYRSRHPDRIQSPKKSKTTLL